MNSDNHTTQDYSNLSMDQTGNNFVLSVIDNNNENFQHTANHNTNLDTLHINNTNTTAPIPQNIAYEFYLPLPNDTRIYHVTYTELNSTEIARHLNNRIDISHIPDHQLPHHYNVQHLIRQQIVQQSVSCQQNTISQQPFETMDIQPIFQEYSDNSACDVSSIPPIQQLVDYQQDTDTIPQQSFDTIDVQPTFQKYSDYNAYDASSIPPNSPEDTSRYNGVQLHQNNPES